MSSSGYQQQAPLQASAPMFSKDSHNIGATRTQTSGILRGDLLVFPCERTFFGLMSVDISSVGSQAAEGETWKMFVERLHNSALADTMGKNGFLPYF
jgi:hypothetical protein